MTAMVILGLFLIIIKKRLVIFEEYLKILNILKGLVVHYK